jgi:ATP/maltotriose-dependent transcriptional regulator MalT
MGIHIRHLYMKLDVHDRTAAVVRARVVTISHRDVVTT